MGNHEKGYGGGVGRRGNRVVWKNTLRSNCFGGYIVKVLEES